MNETAVLNGAYSKVCTLSSYIRYERVNFTLYSLMELYIYIYINIFFYGNLYIYKVP